MAGGDRPKVPDLRETLAFKRLDAEVVAFRLSFPNQYKNILNRTREGHIDVKLVTAHSLPHT
jgi:hypothetical protein